jgi:hypothetical protein
LPQHKPCPEGFTIGFNPHGGKRWGWKQTFARDDDEGRPKQKFGYRRRPDALAGLEEELKIREQLAEARREAG